MTLTIKPIRGIISIGDNPRRRYYETKHANTKHFEELFGDQLATASEERFFAENRVSTKNNSSTIKSN